MTDRIQGVSEEEERDILGDQGVIPDDTGPRKATRDIDRAAAVAYPSDRAFAESVRTMRTIGGIGAGIVLLTMAAIFAYVGGLRGLLFAAFFFAIGFLFILYGVGLALGWFRMRWWL